MKDVEMRLSLIFQVGPESNDKYLYKRKAGRNLRHTEEKTGGGCEDGSRDQNGAPGAKNGAND